MGGLKYCASAFAHTVCIIMCSTRICKYTRITTEWGAAPTSMSVQTRPNVSEHPSGFQERHGFEDLELNTKLAHQPMVLAHLKENHVQIDMKPQQTVTPATFRFSVEGGWAQGPHHTNSTPMSEDGRNKARATLHRPHCHPKVWLRAMEAHYADQALP